MHPLLSAPLARARMDEFARGAAEPAPHRSPQPAAPRRTWWEQVGGPAGLAQSAIPSLVFAGANGLAGLRAGVLAALSAAVAVAVVRGSHRRSLRPALGGFVGVAVSSAIAYRTGSARDYFLPDLWLSAACCVLLIGSLAIRRPLTEVLWKAAVRVPASRRTDRPSRRRHDVATGVFAAIFAIRFVVQSWLYHRQATGVMALAKVALNYPLWAIALATTWWAIRGSAGHTVPSGRMRRCGACR